MKRGKRGILDAIDNLKKVNEEEQSIKDMLSVKHKYIEVINPIPSMTTKDIKNSYNEVKIYNNHTKTNEENDKMLSLEATKIYFEQYDVEVVRTDIKRNNYIVFLGNEKFKEDKNK